MQKLISRPVLSAFLLTGLTYSVLATSAAASPQVVGEQITSATATLILRGLDKISGRSTDIIDPIGKPVEFATLRITGRYCYSTPPSETPETVAFLQIDDHRPDQPSKRVFSGWMYSSSPGLNGLDHPLYDVWVITCKATIRSDAAAALASTAPVKVLSPDSTDKEGLARVPEDAGQ